MIIPPTLRLSNPRNPNRVISAIQKRLPPLEGRSVKIQFLPALTAGSRKLYSNSAVGNPVHAATYIRRRKIVLDEELAAQPRELARILTHELFHFAWVRLSNQRRSSYELLIRSERAKRARGELGWSAESRKTTFSDNGNSAARDGKFWREYLCESFCDTAAWLYSGVGRHDEFTLPERYRRKRAAWFHAAFSHGTIPI